MYLKQGAYTYLCEAGRHHLLDVELLLTVECGLEALYFEVQEWMEKLFMLFRNYTVAYIDKQLAARGMRLRESTGLF